MPWPELQARLLRQMGVHWATRVETVQPPPPPVSLEHPGAPRIEVSEARRARAGVTPRATDYVREARPVATALFASPSSSGADIGASVSRDAVPREVQRLDWSGLKSAVAACVACGLCRTRTQTVFGVGHESAHWMVVGEAPGEQEDLRGEPFVGDAGRLLDHMLAALHLTRAVPADTHQSSVDDMARRRVYIANTLKCRPPGNRNPQPEELARCEPFLQRQVELLRPRIILAMGRFAVQSLLRSGEPVGKLRGRVHDYRGVPLVVTYHPGYLLRNPTDKARAWDDLCLAASVHEAGSGLINPSP